jgi:phosphosulfolactate phosphohydrolase-like enzyme
MTFSVNGGAAGARQLASISDVVIVVDVLSFCTAVDIAVSNGAAVLPYGWREEGAREFAETRGAILASRRSTPGADSLSPASLQSIPRGVSVVLPSAANLPGRLSPEAELAVASFKRFQFRLYDAISRCSSGKELIDRRFAEDVELACRFGVSSSAPVLVDGRYLDLGKR